MTYTTRRQMLVRTAGTAAVLGFGLTVAAERPARPMIDVYKSATCTCCEKWVTHFRAAGFPVKVQNMEDMSGIKDQLKVPAGARSCHTAKVGKYFLEGHVPADAAIRLLSTQPKARGLAVPGMPIGSPGMEVEGVAAQAFDILLVHDDGSTSVFATKAAGSGASPATAKGPFVGIGTVKSISSSSVKIAHDPIAAVSWPAMTMDFKLAHDGLSKGLAPGTRVEFTFSDPGDPKISALKPLR
jgi:hypothetical protein